MKLVKISAVWCSGCLIMNKVWNKLNKEYSIETINLDYDLDEEEVMKYNPGKVLPTFIFFRDDKEICRVIGEKSENEMKEIVSGLLDEKVN